MKKISFYLLAIFALNSCNNKIDNKNNSIDSAKYFDSLAKEILKDMTNEDGSITIKPLSDYQIFTNLKKQSELELKVKVKILKFTKDNISIIIQNNYDISINAILLKAHFTDNWDNEIFQNNNSISNSYAEYDLQETINPHSEKKFNLNHNFSGSTKTELVIYRIHYTNGNTYGISVPEFE